MKDDALANALALIATKWQACDVICEHLLAYTSEFPEGKRVNEILNADEDPIGVAAWWVQTNGYLPDAGRPISMLGVAGSHSLIQIAEGMLDE